MKTIEVPGPGQYNPNLSTIKQQTPGGRIGTGKRDGFNFREAGSIPGPGHFNIGDDWTKNMRNPGFGASNRYNVASSKDGPGPGNYNLDERTLNSAPSYTMGGGAVRSKVGKNEMPGPGAYNPRVDYSKENLGSVRIGTSPRGSKY